MPVQAAQSEATLNDETLHELGLTEQPFLEDKSRQRVVDAAATAEALQKQYQTFCC